MRVRKWLLLVLLVLALLGAGGCGADEKYDVIVVGGDPEGVSAAVTAARNGMKGVGSGDFCEKEAEEAKKPLKSQ